VESHTPRLSITKRVTKTVRKVVLIKLHSQLRQDGTDPILLLVRMLVNPEFDDWRHRTFNHTVTECALHVRDCALHRLRDTGELIAQARHQLARLVSKSKP